MIERSEAIQAILDAWAAVGAAKAPLTQGERVHLAPGGYAWRAEQYAVVVERYRALLTAIRAADAAVARRIERAEKQLAEYQEIAKGGGE
jgi:hypothetical protein